MSISSLFLLDDHADTRMLVEHICSDYWPVDSYSNCTDARTALSTQSFDLLVLDLCLPDGSGRDMLRFARNHAASCNENTPAVAITAMVQPGQREALLSEGFDGYLAKPFCRADLLALCRAHLPDPPAS